MIYLESYTSDKIENIKGNNEKGKKDIRERLYEISL